MWVAIENITKFLDDHWELAAMEKSIIAVNAQRVRVGNLIDPDNVEAVFGPRLTIAFLEDLQNDPKHAAIMYLEMRNSAIALSREEQSQ